MARTSSKMTKALSSNKPAANFAGRGCLVVFFGLFFLMGSVFFYFMFLRPVWGIVQARNWVSVPCKIASSEVETIPGDDGATYKIAIVFNYTYDDREWQSDTYDFVTGSSSGRSGKQAIVDRYPPGSEATCWVNPSRPEQAVLNRDFRPAMLFGLIPLVFVAVGLIPVFVYLSGGSLTGTAKQGGSSGTSALSEPLDEDDEEDDDEEVDVSIPTGPQVLKSATPPLTKFLGLLFVCLFWNGIVSVFVTMAVRSFLKGDPQWFLTLFMVPFVLIGLLLVAGVIHSFLNLFNPRPTLTVMNANLALGSQTEVRWVFRGNTFSMRQLKLTLEGTERATYRRGTSTYTDTEKFAEIVLFESTIATQMAAGTATVQIPDRTMHTFKSHHNEIEWKLHLHGTIAFWPDVDEQFVIHVGPSAT